MKKIVRVRNKWTGDVAVIEYWPRTFKDPKKRGLAVQGKIEEAARTLGCGVQDLELV